LRDSSPFIDHVLPEVDYRIHAALNCGANSCPPVGQYTTKGCERELEEAWRGWIGSEVGCRGVEGGYEIR